MDDLSGMKSGALILAIDGHDESTCDCVCCAEWNRRMLPSSTPEEV